MGYCTYIYSIYMIISTANSQEKYFSHINCNIWVQVGRHAEEHGAAEPGGVDRPAARHFPPGHSTG